MVLYYKRDSSLFHTKCPCIQINELLNFEIPKIREIVYRIRNLLF